jgi:hypothetical protein
MKATFVNWPPLSILLTIPAILLLATTLPVTLTSSTVAFFTILATGAIPSAQGILISTLPKLIFFTEPFSTRSNKGRAMLWIVYCLPSTLDRCPLNVPGTYCLLGVGTFVAFKSAPILNVPFLLTFIASTKSLKL